MTYIAAFFSHFGATRFRRLCKDKNVCVELMPVPRAISSSCGTCARFSDFPLGEGEAWPQEVEFVVEVPTDPLQGSYKEIYRSPGA